MGMRASFTFVLERAAKGIRELLTEGGGKLPLLEWKLILDFCVSLFKKKRFMDEVIGMTNGYGCGKRRKSGTVGVTF